MLLFADLPMAQWSTLQVREWLELVGFAQYQAPFAGERIDGLALSGMDCYLFHLLTGSIRDAALLAALRNQWRLGHAA
jgi:hypothetical protein